MSPLLDPSLVETYQTHGVVVLKGLVSPETIAELAEGVERNLASPGPWANEYTPAGSSGRFFDDYVNWQRIDQFARAATSGPIPRAARELMGSKVARLFHEHVLVKEAETREVTPWHHDDPYYGIDGMDNVSIWIPLDPIPDSVALRFIPGSHRWNARFIPRRFADQSAYVDAAHDFVHLPPPDDLEHQATLSTPVEIGDAVAFHYRTLHAVPSVPGAAWSVR